VGKEFPIIIKLQTQDFIEDGMKLEEGLKVAKIIAETGYEAIEASGGSGETLGTAKHTYPSVVVKKPEDENYFLPTVKKIKPFAKDSKLILMGGIKNPIVADKLLEHPAVDFISMSRPFIREPDLPNRWRSGDTSPAKCVSCNSCYMTMLSGPAYCVVEKRLKRKRLREQKKEGEKQKK